eukprot:TRINITY_DN11769_c0_g1_i7.p1 TRINITY_DN11769_c0_g1~~TRINITY_DN11769_c0_g1_i7.p1  ORF type:complete len:708 (+),score=77.00 TRINITY_DN11769_c0_g1_i7:63-2126(+)
MHSENISSLNEQVQSLSVASAVQRSNITGIEQALTSQATRLRLTEQSADMQSANISSLRGELHDLSEASANNVVEAKESLASLSSAIESAQSTQTAGDESLVEQLDATSDDVNITKVKVHELEGTISTILSCQQALKFYNATSSACIPPPRDPLRACEQDSDCGNNFICVHREPLAYCQCPIGHSLDDGICRQCPEAMTTSNPGAQSCDVRVAWTFTSRMEGFHAHLDRYPDTHYELGATYNNRDILPLHYHSPSPGVVAAMVHPMYPQNDARTSLQFGTAVFLQGLDSGATDPADGRWQHYYYRPLADANYAASGSNNNGDYVALWTRPRKYPYRHVGLLQDWDAIRLRYPPTHYYYGIKVEGKIQAAHLNRWNMGDRITCSPFHPRGYDSTNLPYMTTVFTRGLLNDKFDGWNHNWYKAPNEYVHGLGAANRFEVYVMKMDSPWVQDLALLGLAQFDSLTAKYSSREYEYGLEYNGAIRPMIINSWNDGYRATLYPFFFMGDDATELTLGTTVFTRGLRDAADGDTWYHHYYMIKGDGGVDEYGHGDGDASTVQFYVRKRESPWQLSTFKLGNVEASEDVYSLSTHQRGLTYNTQVLPLTRNSWNIGTRVSIHPIYPTLDDSTALRFGTTVFTKGLSGENPEHWLQAYYWYPKTFYTSNSGDYSDRIDLYIRNQTYDETFDASFI